MGLFWRRKKEDRFVTLGLSEAAAERALEKKEGAAPAPPEPPAGAPAASEAAVNPPAVEPVPTGAPPTPQPAAETGLTEARKEEVIEAPRPTRAAQPDARESAREGEPGRAHAPVPQETRAPQPARPAARASFSSSILGLDRSEAELQAEIEALEQSYAARFSRAIEATRESLSEKIDTVFQNRKQIDAELLDELEEALIAADIGVPVTLEILDRVRRAVSRTEIGDISALKAALKGELLTILRKSEEKGVASEESVPEAVAPYVIMVVGVNGVGKTTTIGKLAQRSKAEGNDG